jgi:hypothetical protein
MWTQWQNFNRGCARVANALSKFELLKILEYVGKAAVLVAVVSWILECPQRQQANRRVAWSVVDSKGGGRREALEYLYENKVDLRGLYAEGGFFGNIDLRGADLVWANVKDSNFEEANLQNADLRDAHFERARLTGANLASAHLNGAYLNGAHLRGADLTRANLCDAVLTSATLDHAVLTGADLGGSDLRRASGLIQMQVDAAGRGDWNTKLPAGIIAPKSWPISPRLRVWFTGVLGPTETVCW